MHYIIVQKSDNKVLATYPVTNIYANITQIHSGFNVQTMDFSIIDNSSVPAKFAQNKILNESDQRELFDDKHFIVINKTSRKVVAIRRVPKHGIINSISLVFPSFNSTSQTYGFWRKKEVPNDVKLNSTLPTKYTIDDHHFMEVQNISSSQPRMFQRFNNQTQLIEDIPLAQIQDGQIDTLDKVKYLLDREREKQHAATRTELHIREELALIWSIIEKYIQRFPNHTDAVEKRDYNDTFKRLREAEQNHKADIDRLYKVRLNILYPPIIPVIT